MAHRAIRFSVLFFILSFSASCHHPSKAVTTSAEFRSNTTVIWVSIDGLRHDYIARVHPPTLERLAREGVYTNQEVPVFPSLTFPNHAAQATGRRVNGSGIPANGFYDPDTKQQYYLPDDAWLMRAEPIWVTAKRQGVRSAVVDWPMSHNQTGPFTADYFGKEFNKKETDEQRLNRVVELLKNDRGTPPLRLVMTYISKIDTTGHSFGPDSPEVDRAVRETDASLGRFVASVTQWFAATRDKNEELVILLTTDHGMENVHTQVNLDRLIGGDQLPGAKIVLSGPIATIHLLDVPADEKEERAKRIVEKLSSSTYLNAWQSKQVPEKYHFADPTRIGDVTVLLSPGYTFTAVRAAATQPATSLKGNHGYDPAVSSNMLGSAILWSNRQPMGGRDLGSVQNTQWTATVANLLGIDPPAGCDPKAVPIPSR